jgi:hypothetical protein
MSAPRVASIKDEERYAWCILTPQRILPIMVAISFIVSRAENLKQSSVYIFLKKVLYHIVVDRADEVNPRLISIRDE